MNSHHQMLNSINNKSEAKTNIITATEAVKPYIKYANELQDLLFAKIEEFDQFKEMMRRKIKG